MNFNAQYLFIFLVFFHFVFLSCYRYCIGWQIFDPGAERDSTGFRRRQGRHGESSGCSADGPEWLPSGTHQGLLQGGRPRSSWGHERWTPRKNPVKLPGTHPWISHSQELQETPGPEVVSCDLFINKTSFLLLYGIDLCSLTMPMKKGETLNDTHRVGSSFLCAKFEFKNYAYMLLS